MVSAVKGQAARQSGRRRAAAAVDRGVAPVLADGRRRIDDHNDRDQEQQLDHVCEEL
jgi:hypothetical protein